jgi:hypothetical protein
MASEFVDVWMSAVREAVIRAAERAREKSLPTLLEVRNADGPFDVDPGNYRPELRSKNIRARSDQAVYSKSKEPAFSLKLKEIEDRVHAESQPPRSLPTKPATRSGRIVQRYQPIGNLPFPRPVWFTIKNTFEGYPMAVIQCESPQSGAEGRARAIKMSFDGRRGRGQGAYKVTKGLLEEFRG